MDVALIGELLSKAFPPGSLDELVEERDVDTEAVEHSCDGRGNHLLVDSVVQIPGENLQWIVHIEIVADRTHRRCRGRSTMRVALAIGDCPGELPCRRLP